MPCRINNICGEIEGMVSHTFPRVDAVTEVEDKVVLFGLGGSTYD